MTTLSMSTGVVPVRTPSRAGAPARRAGRGRVVPASPARAEVARGRVSRGRTLPARTAAAVPVRGALHATVRGRRVVLGLIVVVSAGLGLLGGQAVAATPAVPAETVRVVVEPGDTLWEFALGLVEPGEDIRDVVLEIQELNGMGSAALSVGDELLLPAA